MSVTEPTGYAAGRQFSTGTGPDFRVLDIGHKDWVAVVEPRTAFWSLVAKTGLADTLTEAAFGDAYRKKAAAFDAEIGNLRFGLSPSAVYLNPTERCNLNCTYCYIPGDLRQGGSQMDVPSLLNALGILKTYFQKELPTGRKAQIIFHGAEPLLCKDGLLAAFEGFKDDFRFGVQTNGTLMDADFAAALRGYGVSVGLSLDAPEAETADRTRRTWGGAGVHDQTLKAMELFRGYDELAVICTVTSGNMAALPALVDFFHEREVHAALLNVVRCTLPGARLLKPDEKELFGHFEAALERADELRKRTGRKLIVANFANILLALMAPAARRLMCDLSPCGAGRAFLAIAPDGGAYPCSEFIGLPRFRGGNLFADSVPEILASAPFRQVVTRDIDTMDPCGRCAIKHFCGSPCPAEAVEMNGGIERPGAYCVFYEEQVRYALRLIADGRAEDFLWDDWDQGTTTSFEL
jgi:uncharacterized protein